MPRPVGGELQFASLVTRFRGFVKQKGQPLVTIQLEVEKCLAVEPVWSSEKPCACLRVAASAKAGRHLSIADSRDRFLFRPLLQPPVHGYPSHRRSAMQGFGEDCTGTAGCHFFAIFSSLNGAKNFAIYTPK